MRKANKVTITCVQYVKVGNKAKVFGLSNSRITIGYMTMDDVPVASH